MEKIIQTGNPVQSVDENTDEQTYRDIRLDAERVTGSHGSLRVRARCYLDIYEQSNGSCGFALIAANGALWGAWYLNCGRLAAYVFAVADRSCKLSVREKVRQFSAYVDVLKDINRLVMLETYVLIHTIQKLGVEFAMSKDIPEALAVNYATAMKADFPDPALLRDIYQRHFLWEQERIVSDKLTDAFEVFNWPYMKDLCQRPWVWFSYFRPGRSMNFKNFTDQVERQEKGLVAYDRAVICGVAKVSKSTNIRLKIFPGTKTLGI